MALPKLCIKCEGRGMYVYGSTSMWMGGPGGQMLSEGTCDRCWGTGDENNPGENLRIQMLKAEGRWRD